MLDQNLNQPEESTSADVTLVTRGITVPVSRGGVEHRRRRRPAVG